MRISSAARLAQALCCVVVAAAATVSTDENSTAGAKREIWLSAIFPFTNPVDFPLIGVVMQLGAEVMLEEINKKADLLPDYELKIGFQNGWCDGKTGNKVFLENVFQDTYEMWAPGVPLNQLKGPILGPFISPDYIRNTFGQVWTSANMSGGPVGMLVGCTAPSKTIAPVAYFARQPLVTGLAADPALSDRSVYPNFWRTIVPENALPAALFHMTGLLGFPRTTVILGDTETWGSRAPAYHRAALEKNITLDGPDLSILVSSDPNPEAFRGYQISQFTTGSELAATSDVVAAVEGIRQLNNRIIMPVMHIEGMTLLLCEMYKRGMENFILMANGNVGLGSWSPPEENPQCQDAAIKSFMSGFFTATGTFWRTDMNTQLSCSDSMTAAGFQTQWYVRNMLTPAFQGGPSPGGWFPAYHSTTVADAVCMFAQMLHTILYETDFTLEDLQRRDQAAYEKIQELFAATDFEGVTGRIKFNAGSGDPVSDLLVYHQQGITDLNVDVGYYSTAEGVMTFWGPENPKSGNLIFKLPGENFSATSGSRTIDASVAHFVDCGTGQLLNHSSNECYGAGPDQVFVSTAGQFACKAGYEDAGDDGCVECRPGSFSKAVGSTQCELCEVGKFASENLSTGCVRCTLGKYQDQVGQPGCQQCANRMTTILVGAESASDCLCGPGTSWMAVTGQCEPECKPGTRRAVIGQCESCGDSDITGIQCVGGVEVGEGVMIAQGFFSAGFSPIDMSLSIFKCFQADGRSRCRGGKPGMTCAPGRQGLLCFQCMPNMKETDDGSCVPCEEGTPGKALFGIFCVVSLVILIGVYFIIDSKGKGVQSHSMLMCGLVFSMAVTATQQLGVMALFSEVDWPEPLRGLLTLVSIVTFDIDILNLNCIASISSLGRFTTKVFLMGIFAVLLVLIHFGVVIVLHRGKFGERNASLVGCIGTIFLVFFISVISTVVGPLQCVKHPNGMWTVSSYEDVICWDSSEHGTMVAIGLVALLVPLTYLGGCCYCVYRFPEMMLRGRTDFLHMFNFLFFRYRPEAYWYSLVHIFRSLVIANLPIIPNAAAQIIAMQVVLVSQLLFVMEVKPWRVPVTNKLDILFTSGLLFIITCGSYFVDTSPNAILAWMALFLIMLPFACLPFVGVFAAYAAYNPRKTFQYFICHHKAGAGALARLLKMQLQKTKGVTRGVFVDSDNLIDLDALFDQVGSSTETLVIVGTKEIFLRLWCVGEVTTARQKGVNAVRFALPDFKEPDDNFVAEFEMLAGDLSILTHRGISVEDACAAILWTNGLRTIQVSGIDEQRIQDVAYEIVFSSVNNSAPTVVGADGASTVIIHDGANMEAMASALVLEKMLGPLFSFSPELMPRVLSLAAAPPRTARRALLLCTPGALEQENVVRNISRAISASHKVMRFMPVVADEGFRFPNSSTFQEEHMDLAVKLGGSEEAALALIETMAGIFKVIAVSFLANQASEDVLRLRARDLHKRIQSLDNTSMEKSKAVASPIASGSFSVAPPKVQSNNEVQFLDEFEDDEVRVKGV